MTRFEVVMTKRMRETRSITVSGALGPVESTPMSESVDEVRCGWCGDADSITEIGPVTTHMDGSHGG